MKAEHAITNQYQDFQVLNLSELVGRVEGRGPFIVTQDGCDPNDPTLRECSFVLTKRGSWLHFYLYIALPEPVRAKCAYWETIPEVLHGAESLPDRVVVEDAASLQDLLRQCGFEPGSNDPSGQALFREIKRRHLAHSAAEHPEEARSEKSNELIP